MNADIQAEKTLALTLVANPAAFDYCGDVIEAEMFVDPLAHRVFKAVQTILLRGQPVSAVAVQAVMLDEGKGATVVPNWTQGKTVAAQDVAPLAARIREMWQRRELSNLGARLAETTNSEASISEVGALLARIQNGRGRARSMAELTMNYVEELQREAANPTARMSFDTGYGALDRNTGGLQPGVLWVLAARPGVGKTAFVTGIMAHLAKTGVPCGAFWLEDDWHDAVRRYHQTRNFIPAAQLRGSMAAQRMNEVALKGYEEQCRLFIDDTHGLTINDIAARMRRMHREHGVRVFFADHLGEMRVEKEDRWGDRHDLALGKAARIFRDTAKELGAAPVLISQMNRQIERRESGEPRMADLDGSGQVEQAARLIGFLSKPLDDTGTATGDFFVNLIKNTNGTPGKITLRWCAERMAVE